MGKAEIWLPKLTDHVLATGLSTASLRPLAKAVGTSDRMLIYHFGSKDALVTEILTEIAARFTALLDSAVPPGPMPDEATMMRTLVGMMRATAAAPYTRVWLDIVARAAGGAAADRDTAQTILAGFAEWIAARLPAGTADPTGRAAALLTLLEGAIVMDAAGQGALVDRMCATLFPAPET